MPVDVLPCSLPDVRIAHRGPVVLSCFVGWPSAGSLKAAIDAQRRVIGTHGKVMTMTVIPPFDTATARAAGVPLNLEDRERSAAVKASADAAAEVSASTVASAMVILPKGVIGVMVRSFMAMLALTSSSTVPLKTFRTVEEAVSWLESVPGTLGPFPDLAKDIAAWVAAGR
jgi:hypothetical protein